MAFRIAGLFAQPIESIFIPDEEAPPADAGLEGRPLCASSPQPKAGDEEGAVGTDVQDPSTPGSPPLGVARLSAVALSYLSECPADGPARLAPEGYPTHSPHPLGKMLVALSTHSYASRRASWFGP